ncbi:MAG: HAD-IA family hydrolase [Anaerolineales bacterium]|nr:HAD-IA family hydrolase [Anaerolineales bacterium]
MTLTLLLDLDDTLLDNNIDAFLPQYLSAFSNFVADKVPPDRFVSTLLLGTRAMVKNRRPDCTLREVFESNFFPVLDLDAAEFQDIADQFYKQIFPTLRTHTRFRPEAVEMVQEFLRRGYRVAIATNPLFPRMAIEHRLSWAGLPVDQYPFELVTSYESFHFTKPDTAYFGEVMARLGWPDGPVLVVGDDLANDISPARRLGLAAFWVGKDGLPSSAQDGPTASGNLSDILRWIDSQPSGEMQTDFTSPEAMLAILRSTPAAMDGMLRGLAVPAWTRQPFAGEWSLVEVICHLRDVDQEVNLERVRKVVDETNPFIPGKDTDPWAVERGYNQQNGEQALQEFTATRLKLLDLLENLPAEGWRRPARHAIFGPTLLSELVNIIASHDRLHIQQIYTLIKAISST